MKSLFLVSGEISGDTHGSALMLAIREHGEISFSGLGGPKMHELSAEVEDWLDQAAVLGLWEVLKKYSYFRAKLDETIQCIVDKKPDGVVLIDYPGFNLRLAKALREENYTGKLIYYISPQVWAWKRSRIKTMARLLDLMICIFPFEKGLYEESGLPTVFAGHPLVDSMAKLRDANLSRRENLVALLPGSREREIAKLYPEMLAAARILKEQIPDLEFATSGATPVLTEKLREMTEQAGLSDCIDVREKASHEIMQTAWVGVVASGTATLEAACLGLPYCLVYKVAWLTAVVARRVMSVNYLGIVNVMANREIVPELLQDRATGQGIADGLRRLLENAEARIRLQSDLAEVVRQLSEPGREDLDAHGCAAEAVLNSLGDSPEVPLNENGE